jgi:hypothetical protein
MTTDELCSRCPHNHKKDCPPCVRKNKRAQDNKPRKTRYRDTGEDPPEGEDSIEVREP